MRKILFVIADYKDERQKIFEEQYSPRNAEYAARHGFEYRVEKGGTLVRGNPTWWKFTKVREMIERGELRDGDKVTHLDADMVFVDGRNSYETEKSFSYAIDSGNTHCMGSYSLTINSWSRKLIDMILDEALYEAMKENRHWQEFREQAAWYTLCGILPHSDRPFHDFANYGWHSYPTTHTRFSVDELHQHVEVRGPNWNTTILESELRGTEAEGLLRYNINPTRADQTIIRHFAGGQRWLVHPYCDRPMW